MDIHAGGNLRLHRDHPGKREGRKTRAVGYGAFRGHVEVVFEQPRQLLGAVTHFPFHELHFEDAGEKGHHAVISHLALLASDNQSLVGHAFQDDLHLFGIDAGDLPGKGLGGSGIQGHLRRQVRLLGG